MIRNYTTVAILTSQLLFNPIAHSQETDLMNSEKQAVIDAVETMTAAFHKQDIKAVMASYEKGAAVMFEPAQQTDTTDQVKQMFQGFFQFNPQFTYPQGHEVYIANDIALHISPWVMQGTSADGQKMEQNGLSVAVLRRQANNQWQIVLDNPHGQRLMAE